MRPVNKPVPPTELVNELLSSRRARKIDPLTLLRMQLQSTIGYYCSFCEIPINVTQATISKYTRQLKRVPTLSQWSELLLACDFCQLHRTGDLTNLSDYLWPDTDATFSLGSDSPFLYALKDVTYVVKPDSGTDGRTDRADRTAASADSSTKSLVIVAANPQSTVSAKATRTIDLFKLNTPFYDAATNTFTITESQLQARIDPRVDLRTQAWTAAAQAIASLQELKALTAYPIAFDSLVKITAALAQASGFWSGWMTSLWQAFSDKAVLGRMTLEVSKREGYVLTGFQTLPDGGTPPWTIFTGTAVDRVKF